MPHGFDNTWGIVKDSSLVLSASSLVLCLFVVLMLSASIFFQLVFVRG